MVIQPGPSASSTALVRERAPGAGPAQVPGGERELARLCFAAVPLVRPVGNATEIDWEASAALRLGLAQLGFGVAEALDPEERATLGWERTAELFSRTGSLHLAHGFVAGAGSDHLHGAPTIAELVAAVVHQASLIEEAGGVPLLLPLAALSRRRATEDEYVEVYRAILERLSGPVLVDWVGARQRPELLDYFPGQSFERVMAFDPAKVRGARCALGHPARDVRVRRALLVRDQLLFSADREHLARLLLGGSPSAKPPIAPVIERFTEFAGRAVALGDFSHAMPGLLGESAQDLRAALDRLSTGDVAGYLERVPELA